MLQKYPNILATLLETSQSCQEKICDSKHDMCCCCCKSLVFHELSRYLSQIKSANCTSSIVHIQVCGYSPALKCEFSISLSPCSFSRLIMRSSRKGVSSDASEAMAIRRRFLIEDLQAEDSLLLCSSPRASSSKRLGVVAFSYHWLCLVPIHPRYLGFLLVLAFCELGMTRKQRERSQT